MAEPVNDLTFHQGTAIELAGNTFINVPVLIQYENDPLFEVVHEVDASWTTQFRIYNKDGIYLAKAKGTQLYPTDQGTKAGLKMRYESHLTAC